MQLGNIGKAFISGSIVYVIMAACAASDGGSFGKSDTADAGYGGSGGQGGADSPDASHGDALADASDGKGGGAGSESDSGDSWLDAAIDAIVDPVPDAAADDGNKDGSRLKARYYVAEDGARQFAGWFDTQRGEECSFQMASDGKRRCLPTGQLSGSGFHYADASCTQPIAPAVSGCSSPALAAIWEASAGCGAPSVRLYSVAAKVTGASIYYGANGTCTPMARGEAEYFRLGSELSPSAFVTVTIE